MEEKYLTERETSEYTGIAVKTLQNWRSGKTKMGPPFVKPEGAIRYRLSDLEAWLASRTVHPGK